MNLEMWLKIHIREILPSIKDLIFYVLLNAALRSL